MKPSGVVTVVQWSMDFFPFHDRYETIHYILKISLHSWGRDNSVTAKVSHEMGDMM